MAQNLSPATIEETLDTRIMEKADVIVVSGAPGRHTAAITASRNYARTKLLEKYGYPGGAANGGIVIRILVESELVNIVSRTC
jgi:ribulose 1,5-bisphosphate synthetase/thiazole synthase